MNNTGINSGPVENIALKHAGSKKHIEKIFRCYALGNISLELHPGKVNAIIGENGAGKSTLMKIFSGVHTQYEGEIIYNGQQVKFSKY